MKYVRLGKTGLEVSRICLGMMSFGNKREWELEIDQARPIVNKALDLGINFFDTANVYSSGRSEEITGELLEGSRDDVIIATKVYLSASGIRDPREKPNQIGLSRKMIRRELNGSLKRLNVDYIDLYQIHRLDPNVPMEEILKSLNILINAGKVLHIGASSMFAWQFCKSLWVTEKLGLEPFRTMQNHYNLVYREEEREMIPLCKDQGIGIIPWSPLARGFLSGKYSRSEEPDSPRARSDPNLKRRYFHPADFDIVEAVVDLAKEKDFSPAQIALAWLFSKDYITSPILGVTKVEHLEQAVEALDIKLSDDEIKKLEDPYKPHRVIGHA
ncbi:MAG: aldo/keto reductase [Promethearchaeota archaeon]|jgi:aryl-alcohol dehydrogenase (NADP+)